MYYAGGRMSFAFQRTKNRRFGIMLAVRRDLRSDRGEAIVTSCSLFLGPCSTEAHPMEVGGTTVGLFLTLLDG
jgi:hypothetical protein